MKPNQRTRSIAAAFAALAVLTAILALGYSRSSRPKGAAALAEPRTTSAPTWAPTRDGPEP